MRKRKSQKCPLPQIISPLHSFSVKNETPLVRFYLAPMDPLKGAHSGSELGSGVPQVPYILPLPCLFVPIRKMGRYQLFSPKFIVHGMALSEQVIQG